jgi:hypothetical protein
MGELAAGGRDVVQRELGQRRNHRLRQLQALAVGGTRVRQLAGPSPVGVASQVWRSAGQVAMGGTGSRGV